MSKKKSYWLLAVSFITLLIALTMGIILLNKYGPQKALTKAPPEIVSAFIPDNNTPALTIEPLIPTEDALPTAIATEIVTATSAPDWMSYNNLDLKDQAIEVLTLMNCNNDSVYLDPFNVIPWYPEVFSNGDFLISANNSVAWEHLGYHGLWVHSGLDAQNQPLAAYPLQDYLERDARGYIRYPQEFDQAVEECLIGSQVRIKQGDSISVNKVVAAVRVEPEEVEELSTHVMDLVPYLIENYPDKGFEQFDAPGMLLYFCGRALSGERKILTENYWVQSRIIIAFEPAEESEFPSHFQSTPNLLAPVN